MAKVEFAWELGAHTGHVTTMLPVAAALKARGHEVRFLLREPHAAADLEGAAEIPREGAPIWSGPTINANPLNLGEILLNFGYHEAGPVKALIDAWREQLRGSQAVIANVAPAAHLAARTLGIPSFEVSQGFHVPPPAMPAAPLRDWEPAPRARLEAADRRVLNSINQALAAFRGNPLTTIGDLFAGRSMLLTYPELDVYPERGPSDYYGITKSAEGKLVPDWPVGDGPRVFVYLYHYYKGLASLADALARQRCSTLALCRGVDSDIKGRHHGGSVYFAEEPMSVSRVLPQADIVICHASHQMTAQALLAGKPLLLLPTQLEQFLITRRVVRYGAGLGIAPEVNNPDYTSALTALAEGSEYASKAREFSDRYARHERGAALATMIARIEAALG